MTDPLDELMYQAGLTAQGCWDEMDEYDRAAILKFAQLIVQECADIIASRPYIDNGNWPHPSAMIKQHFGVKDSKREKFRKSFEEAFKGGVDLSGQETP